LLHCGIYVMGQQPTWPVCLFDTHEGDREELTTITGTFSEAAADLTLGCRA
jgi:hypothetical protein